MHINEIDVFDDEVFHRYHEIYRAAEMFERPHAPVWSEHEAAVMFHKPDDAERLAAYGAFGAMGLTAGPDEGPNRAQEGPTVGAPGQRDRATRPSSQTGSSDS
ncbi:MAG: hypothetical protein H0U28_11560 [Nocardioidaceae bacterium]|nr:hypothetical protein [Nocardioidaceae bacterium]